MAVELNEIEEAEVELEEWLVEQATNTEVRSTARPVRFQWDDHQWYPIEGDAVAPNG